MEDNRLELLGNQCLSLDVDLIDGEFEDPSVLTVEAWVQWRDDIDWPENEHEHVTLYTVGQPGTVPLQGQSIPADYPLANNVNDAQGALQAWQFKRCSGSWGKRFLFVDFFENRLTGNDDNIATAILVRGGGGNIDEISSDSYEYPY